MQSRLFIITILIVLVFNVFVSSQNTSNSKSVNNSEGSNDVLVGSSKSVNKEDNEKKVVVTKEVPKVTTVRSTTRSTAAPTTTERSSSSSSSSDDSNTSVSSADAVSPKSNYENKDASETTSKTITEPNQLVVDSNFESNEFEKYLNGINFKIVKPKNNSTISSNSIINVEWECNDVPLEEKHNISVYLQNLNDGKGSFIKSFINLNDKGGNYTIPELDIQAYNYAMWLFTDDYGSHLFYQGPILINANSTAYINSKNTSDLSSQSLLSNHIIWVIIFIALFLVLVYIVALIIRTQRRNSSHQKDYSYEYKEFKEHKEHKDVNDSKSYSKDSQSIHKLLGIEENVNQNDQNKATKPSFNSSSTSTQTINTLAEQLYKAEQVYNNKVFKNPNLNSGNEHCAPLVDMSSLYKSTQEILNKNARSRNKDYMPVNDSYYNRKIMKNQPNDGSKGEESFVVFDDIKNNTKRVSFGRSDSVNSNKILQSVSFSINDDDQVNKPFNMNNNKNDTSESFDEERDTDEDYVNKNSFCLNSKDSIDVFENIYLNKQSDNSSDNLTSNNSMPLTAKVTTVEEFLAAHRESYGSVRLSRTSSLLLNGSIASSIRDSNSFAINPINVVPKLGGKTNSMLSTEIYSIYSSSNGPSPSLPAVYQNIDPLKKPERPERPESMARVSGSDFNSSSLYVDSSMNESLLEELDSIEKQIQQQKQQMYHLSPNQQDIDPNQLNIQMANLHQQGIDTDQILPAFSGNKLVPLSTTAFQPVPPNYVTHASPPIQPKTLAMASQSNQPTIPSKPSLPIQLKTPSPPSILKNRASPLSTSSTLYSKSPVKTTKLYNKNGEIISDVMLQKSQESEATLQPQATQDTLSEVNEDEIETIVATHVCNAWYSPNMPDELRMCPGDELIILERFSDGWGYGQNTKGGHGVFPLDCVTYIDYGDKNRVSSMGDISPPSMKQTYSKVNQINVNNQYNNNIVKNNNVPSANLDNVKPSQAVVFDTNDLYSEEDSNDQIINSYSMSDNTGYNQKTYMSNTKNMMSPKNNAYKANNNIPIHYY